MSLNKLFETNKNLEVKGIWLELGNINDDPEKPAEILIARSGGKNTEYDKEVERIGRKNQTAIRVKAINNVQIKNLLKPVYAKHVVKGWKNIKFNDQFVEYSPEVCEQIFNDLPDFYDFIIEQSNDHNLFRQANLDAALGN